MRIREASFAMSQDCYRDGRLRTELAITGCVSLSELADCGASLRNNHSKLNRNHRASFRAALHSPRLCWIIPPEEAF